MKRYIGLARKFVDRGVIEVGTKLDLEAGGWVEIETELGMIPYHLIKEVEILKDEELVGDFSRVLKQEEIAGFENLEAREREALTEFAKGIEKFCLDMKPVAALITSDDQRIIFYFTAPERVDFRRLVRDLASTFNRVIRLQHVSSRIAAMAKGGIGPCGRKICCHSGIINKIEEVPSSLLDNQNLNGVDSSKLSGICNKLVCCLSYEDDLYTSLKKDLPKVGQEIKVGSEKVKVVDVNPIKKSVLVKSKSGVNKEVSLDK